MKKIKKYLLLAFLIENLCIKYNLVSVYMAPVFYTFLSIGIIMLFFPSNWKADDRGHFGWIFLLSFLYAFDCFVVGLEYIDLDNILFLVAKISSFVIIITSLNDDFNLYEQKTIYWIGLLAGILLVIGIVFPSEPIILNGEERSAFGFCNSNSMGAIATISFGSMIFSFKDRKWTITGMIIAAIAVFSCFASGSRGSIATMAILLLLRYKITLKMIILCSVILIIFLVVFPNIGIEVAGVTRVKETIEGEMGTNRDDEREAAIWMIKEHPFTGWGLKTENQGGAAQITMMSSHNGYLDLAKTMGIPLALLWVVVVYSVVIKYLLKTKKDGLPFDFFCAYSICILFKGMFEGIYAGIHEIDANMFFYCLAVLSKRLYDIKQC